MNLEGIVAAAAAKSLQSCPTLCDPIKGSPPGSAVPGVPQARTLEWAAISFANAWKWKVKMKSQSEVAQSCPTLWNSMDRSLLGSSAHGIFQARVLEWVALPSLRRHYAKWNKQDIERQILYDLTYTWNLKVLIEIKSRLMAIRE